MVNWNTKDLLRTCLGSIAKFSPREEYEVIVVDNSSNDGSAEMISREFPDVQLIAADRNLGYAAGNNLAVERAQGEWLLTLNPDTEFVDASLDFAVATLRDCPSYGALAGKLVGRDGKVQRSVRDFPTVWGILGGRYWLKEFDYGDEGPAPQPMGSFLLYRKSALEAVGNPRKPFDEQFPIFFNEVDLLARMKAAGWPCLYTPKVQVIHHGGMSTKQLPKEMVWESHRSLARYLWKHGGIWFRILGWPFVAGALWTGALVRAKGFYAGFRA